MVERRPTLGILAHVVLLLGVAIVAFPLYVTFVASTQTAEEILHAPMSLLPGSVCWRRPRVRSRWHGSATQR